MQSPSITWEGRLPGKPAGEMEVGGWECQSLREGGSSRSEASEGGFAPACGTKPLRPPRMRPETIQADKHVQVRGG